MTFHVFLSHNSEDKPTVKRLGAALKKRGLNVWLDEWELRPGLTWQDALEDIIQTCGSAAVCVADNGIGPWEDPEMNALLRRFISEKKAGNILPVIPVLLPGAPADIKLPIFLEAFTWVDLRGGLTSEGLDRLQWGITSIKPESNGGQTSTPPQSIPLQQTPATATAGKLTGPEKLDYLPSEGDVSNKIRSSDEGRSLCRLTLDVPSREEANQLLPSLIIELRRITGDVRLSITEIPSGSVILVLDVDDAAAKSFGRLIESGDLTTILGYPIRSFHSGKVKTAGVRSAVSLESSSEGIFAEPNAKSLDDDLFREAMRENPLLLMTAVPVELKAVCSRMRPLPDEDSLLRCYVGQETYYGGLLGQYRVVLTMCGMGSSSRDGVLGAAMEAMDTFRPRAVIMPGIGFGMDSDKQKLGDVMVASQVIPYELSRVAENLTIARSAHSEAGAILLNRFRNAEVNWDHRVLDQKVKIRIGPMLSGEKLVDNKVFKEYLRQEFPKAIGGEMEGAGLSAAAARNKCEWILVKGIADWADGSKTKDWQPFAALAAATLVETVLSDEFALADLSDASVTDTSPAPVTAVRPPEEAAVPVAGQPDTPSAVPAGKRESLSDVCLSADNAEAIDGLDGRQADVAANESTGEPASSPAPQIDDRDPSVEAERKEPDPKAAFIATELLQAVCDQLNSEAEPFRTLRAQLIKKLTGEGQDDTETTVDFLVQALTEKLNEVMSTLRMWLDSTDRMKEGEGVRRLIDAVGTAGFDAAWIEQLLDELKAGHLHVPIETDLHLCEVIFTALYKKPATWIRGKEIDHGAIRAIATPSTKPSAHSREIRRRLVQTHFKDRISREVGESDANYEKRLDDWAERDLPGVLEVEREDQKPWFVLFLETVDAVKKDMEIDPALWSRILKLEKSAPAQRDLFVYDRPKLQNRLTVMHTRLDELDAKARKGPSL